MHAPPQKKPAPSKRAKPAAARPARAPVPATNRTGLPGRLKAGMESLSGLAMDDVRVHYNSSRPARLQALAYAQGTEIHVGPGQERHLPHEAWHVVQQKQGRVRPTLEAGKVAVNDEGDLEREADTMGARAAAAAPPSGHGDERPSPAGAAAPRRAVAQRVYIWNRAAQAAPVWIAENEPPANPPYLESGTHDDGMHRRDRLYVRFSPKDTIYGLYFDEGDEMDTFREGFFPIVEALAGKTLAQLSGPEQEALFSDGAVIIPALARYEREVGKPLIDYALVKAIYGGAGANVNPFTDGGGKRAWALQLKALNPAFPWGDDRAFPSTMSIAATLADGGVVRFLLDGIKDVAGILDGTSENAGKITSHELRMVLAMLDEPIALPPEANAAEGETVVATEGTNVFFYLNRKPVSAAVVRWVTSDKATLAEQLALKLANEEEWDEDEDEDDIAALRQALAGSELSEDDLIACLQLS
jgi:Domain of unknown function (DUF4157)